MRIIIPTNSVYQVELAKADKHLEMSIQKDGGDGIQIYLDKGEIIDLVTELMKFREKL